MAQPPDKDIWPSADPPHLCTIWLLDKARAQKVPGCCRSFMHYYVRGPLPGRANGYAPGRSIRLVGAAFGLALWR